MHGGRELVPPLDARVDKERLIGTINEIAGRAKRQVGEWTGDKQAQVEGLEQEMRGKAQQAWSGVKEALRRMQAETFEGQEGKPFHDEPYATFLAAFRSRDSSEQR